VNRKPFAGEIDSGLPESIPSHQAEQRGERYYSRRWSLIRSNDGVLLRDQRFDGVVGTHLYVDALHSPVPIGIRVGTDSNPFIPVQEGDTIVRPQFNGFTVRHLGPDNPAAGTGEALIRAQGNARFYISLGPLFFRAPKRRLGLRRGFEVIQIKRTGAGSFDLGNILAQVAGDLTSGANVGRGAHLYLDGGFALRNDDAVRWMFWWGIEGEADRTFPSPGGGTFRTGWLVKPGEVQNFDDVESIATEQVILPTGAGTITGRTGIRLMPESVPATIQVLIPYRPYHTALPDFDSGKPLPELNP